MYLDQLHWVTLAQHLWAPEQVAERNREAAAELIALARSRRILLPFSSAHMTEAATTWGRRRHDFVLTVFSLSGGWQMTSPFRVRAEELRRSLSGLEPVVADVFTLEPDSIFTERTQIPSAPVDFPALFQEVHRRLTAVSALFASMVDDERANPRPWAGSSGAMGQQLRAAVSRSAIPW